RGAPLLNRGDEINDIAFGDLVDAPARPGLAEFRAEKPGDLGPGAVLGQTLQYERSSTRSVTRRHLAARFSAAGPRSSSFAANTSGLPPRADEESRVRTVHWCFGAVLSRHRRYGRGR